MVNYTEFLNCTVGNASIEYSHCLADVPAYEDCPDPSICEDASAGRDNVGLAFALTVGAGLATTLGALLPFVPFIKRRNTRFLAAAMALAAGVMLYVSFTEIRTKSLNSFCCLSLDHYEVFTMSAFFGGILLTAVLDALVWTLQKADCGLGSRRLKRVKFSTGQRRERDDDTQCEERLSEDGWRRRSGGKSKVRLHAVNNGNEFDMDQLDASVLILPSNNRHSGSSTTDESTTPTANSFEEGCDAALEVSEIDRGTEGGGGGEEGAVVEVKIEDNSSVQHSQTLTGEVGCGESERGEGRCATQMFVRVCGLLSYCGYAVPITLLSNPSERRSIHFPRLQHNVGEHQQHCHDGQRERAVFKQLPPQNECRHPRVRLRVHRHGG